MNEMHKLFRKTSTHYVGGNHNGRCLSNPSKCYTMHVSHKAKPIITPYTMKGKRLEQVSHHPYLGLELSKDLTWSHHINKITTKANQMLGIVRRNLHSCSKSVKNHSLQNACSPKTRVLCCNLGPSSSHQQEEN